MTVCEYPNFTYEQLLALKPKYRKCPSDIAQYIKTKYNLKDSTILKNYIGLLNKLSESNYVLILNRIKVLNYSYLEEDKISELVSITVKKATIDNIYCKLYAKLCMDMCNLEMGDYTYREILLIKCGELFVNIIDKGDDINLDNDKFMIFLASLYNNGTITYEYIKYIINELYSALLINKKCIYMICNLLLCLNNNRETNKIINDTLGKLNEHKDNNITKRNRFKIIELLEKNNYK